MSITLTNEQAYRDQMREELRQVAKRVAAERGWLEKWPPEALSATHDRFTVNAFRFGRKRMVQVIDNAPPARGVVATAIRSRTFFESDLK